MTSVLYLTDTRYGQRAWQHPSARHRCYHYADALISHGCNSAVLALDRVSRTTLRGFDHVVFHRPTWSRRFSAVFNRCQDAGLQIHADYDDLIFDPQFAPHSPQHVSGGKALSKVQRQFENTHAAARCFSSFLVSTAYLSEKVSALFPDANTTVLPNSLPRTFIWPVCYKADSDKKTIGYFPGSRGHSEDFKSISSVLGDILSTGARLLIVGRMNPQDYESLPNVTHLSYAAYSDYLHLLSLVDVSVAPLLENEFNQSKSAVKLIESVSVGTPVVASSNQDMCDHDNELSWLVSDKQHWQRALSEALGGDASVRNSQSIVRGLQQRFSVSSRLPTLFEHLECVH